MAAASELASLSTMGQWCSHDGTKIPRCAAMYHTTRNNNDTQRRHTQPPTTKKAELPFIYLQHTPAPILFGLSCIIYRNVLMLALCLSESSSNKEFKAQQARARSNVLLLLPTVSSRRALCIRRLYSASRVVMLVVSTHNSKL